MNGGINLDIGAFVTVFAAVFVAELGDKTQIATMLFSAERDTGRLYVFLAASAALVCSTLVAVLLGGALSRIISRKLLNILAGSGFLIIGILTLIRGIRATV